MLSKLLVQAPNCCLEVMSLFSCTEIAPLVLSSSLDVLCDPTYLVWRKRTPLEAMIGRIAIIDRLLARFSGVFLSLKVNARISVHCPRYHLIITLMISR